MSYIINNFLNNEKTSKKEFRIFSNIYQQLGLAWEFLGLQCKDRDGYSKMRDKRFACKVCGKIKGTDEFYILLPLNGVKKIGTKSKPDSKNSYQSKLFGDKINIAAERSLTVKENGIECNLNEYTIHIRLGSNKIPVNKKYGALPWELPKKYLKNFPVIFDFDTKYRLLGLTILK